MMVKIHVVVFWLMILRSLIDGHQHFGGTYCLHLEGRCEPCWESGLLYRSREENEWFMEMCVMRAMNGEEEDGPDGPMGTMSCKAKLLHDKKKKRKKQPFYMAWKEE